MYGLRFINNLNLFSLFMNRNTKCTELCTELWKFAVRNCKWRQNDAGIKNYKNDQWTDLIKLCSGF